MLSCLSIHTLLFKKKKKSSSSDLCSFLASLGNNGRLPAGLVRGFSGANLIALPKSGGKVRPIAVSLCLRRVVSAAQAVAIKARAAAFFAPFQLGVGVSSACEGIAHVIRARTVADPSQVVWQHDCRNAFNEVTRASIRSQLVRFFPSLLPFFDLCYRGFGALRFLRNGVFDAIDSAEGTQQGDPLGPFFFSLAIQPVLHRLAAQHPAVASVAYIDDVHIVGHLHEVVAAVGTLTSGLSECGLETNAQKCVISLSSLGGLRAKTPPPSG